MKLREYRILLADSMATTIEIPPTMEALKTAINKSIGHCVGLLEIPLEITDDMISVTPYWYDGRTNWDIHVVSIKGYGVFGFTDGPLQENENMENEEYVKVELRFNAPTVKYLDSLVAQGILGCNHEEVINHILRQYLFERSMLIPPVEHKDSINMDNQDTNQS